jgi:hypothetical protein
MLTEVLDAPCCRGDGTAEGVAAAAQSDHFVAHTILSCREGAGNEGCIASPHVQDTVTGTSSDTARPSLSMPVICDCVSRFHDCVSRLSHD